MKRGTSIVTAALLATLSDVAAAQSSLTIFGLLDMNVGRFTGAHTGVNLLDKAAYKVESGGMSTSYWGVRGTEDLGGGVSASFEIGSFIRGDTGASGRGDALPAPVNVAGDPYWAQAAWVALSSTSLGRVRVGNVSTLMFFNSVNSNAFGNSMVFSPLNLVTLTGGPLTGGTGWTNSVVYNSPVLGGFSLGAAHSLSENQGGHNTAVRVAYASGAWAASGVWQGVKKDPRTFAEGTSPNNTRAWQLAASYDFTVVKVFSHFGRIHNDGTEAVPLDISYRIWDISAAIPMGAGRVLAGYAQRKTGDAVAPVPRIVAGGNVERTALTLGYVHDLSKRTDLYAVVTRGRTRTNALPAPSTLVDASADNFAVGARHRF